MHRSFFVCIPIFLFRLSIDLGRLVGLMPLRCQKKDYLAHLSSIVADRVVVRGGHCFCRVVSLLRFTYRIVQYSYIYCSFGRLSIELYSPYMIMINRYTPCWSLPLDNHGPFKIGRNGGGLV
jgi:hypothetical protein